MEPEVYTKNYSSNNNFFRNKRPYFSTFNNVKGSKWNNQDYISNSTKESTEDDFNKKKLENKKALHRVYQKLKNNGTLIMPYVMRKYFNPMIMEKKAYSENEQIEEKSKNLENYIAKNKKSRAKGYCF